MVGCDADAGLSPVAGFGFLIPNQSPPVAIRFNVEASPPFMRYPRLIHRTGDANRAGVSPRCSGVSDFQMSLTKLPPSVLR